MIPLFEFFKIIEVEIKERAEEKKADYEQKNNISFLVIKTFIL